MIQTSIPKTVIKAKHVSFSYEQDFQCVRDVSFALPGQSLTCILGPNGAGKSTLLRMLVGLLKPTTGSIELFARNLSTYSPTDRARQIAYLPQSPVAPDAITVEQLVRLGRHPHRQWGLFESVEDMQVVAESMHLADMSQFAHRRLATLSGGEAQRAHLAAALAQQTPILALDEPTANLDLFHQMRIFGLLRDLVAKRKMTVVAVTHDLNIARSFSDQILLLDRGRLEAVGSADEVLTVERLESVYHVGFSRAVTSDNTRSCLMAYETESTNAPELD